MVKRITAKARRAAAILYGAGCVRAALTPSVCRQLFLTMVRSQLEFGAVIWQPTKKQAEDMEVLQRKFARRALGLPPHSGSWMTISEFGVLPLARRRDLLRLRYFAHVVNAVSKGLQAVFRFAADEVDQGRMQASVTARLKEVLERYGFEDEWRSRSVPATWMVEVQHRVVEKATEQRADDARDSPSLSRYIRRNPELIMPVENKMWGHTRGSWLKRRLRTDTLPLLEVIWRGAPVERSRVEEEKRRRCAGCNEGPEDERHFLDCAGFRDLRADMLRRCEAGLREEKVVLRLSIMRVLRGGMREAAHDLMLGATFVHNIDGGAVGVDSAKLCKKGAEVLHNAVCNYLVHCWRRRAEWYGGVPVRGHGSDGVAVVEQDLWESLRSLRRNA